MEKNKLIFKLLDNDKGVLNTIKSYSKKLSLLLKKSINNVGTRKKNTELEEETNQPWLTWLEWWRAGLNWFNEEPKIKEIQEIEMWDVSTIQPKNTEWDNKLSQQEVSNNEEQWKQIIDNPKPQKIELDETKFTPTTYEILKKYYPKANGDFTVEQKQMALSIEYLFEKDFKPKFGSEK